MRELRKEGVFLRFVCVTLAFLVLAGCATRITLEAQRTPTLDTLGIQRIAIMPFEPTSGNAVFQNAARHATTVATSRIQATNHFTLVSPSVVNDARGRGESIESYVDALFTGHITRVGEDTSSEQGQRRVDGQIINFTYFVRQVEVELTFSFVRARDGSLIGPITRRGRARDSNENRSSLASVETLAAGIIDRELRSLGQDVAPHTITIRRSLERERNKDLRPQMNAARDHVRGGNYIAARQAYMAIWDTHRSVPAAVNASILFEAIGETQNAANFMQEVLAETGNPLARDVLARLNRELAEQAGVEQFDGTLSPVERVANLAINEILGVLPPDVRLWIHNNADTNQNLVSDVIDNMTSTFLSRGIPIVERNALDLILSEQNFQMEGNVSDDDFVGIGNLAGANTIVIVDITGTGAGRRLQVRVLSIELGRTIWASGTGSEWQL